MSRRIFRDVEEALAREVRRITFHNNRTVDTVVLQDLFDPFTGEVIKAPIQPSFYDSGADTNNIQYPYFTIRLIKSREDRFSGRVVPQYGNGILTPIVTSPSAFKVIIQDADGSITAPGNLMQTSQLQIRKAQPGYLLRLLSGNNKGTYKIATVVPSSSGPHSITVSNTLVDSIPTLLFSTTSRELYFNSPIDLNTVVVGDNFVDSVAASFPITAIDLNHNKLVLGGVGSPNPASGSTITRTGNVFINSDPSPVRYLVMDPSQSVTRDFATGPDQAGAEVLATNPAVPIDAWYMIRIDSKERASHIDVLNRMWEEFNPPRTGLTVIERSPQSAEQLLTADIPTGGSSTVNVTDNSDFNINDPIFVIDDFSPTKSTEGGFQEPFSAKVIGKIANNQLVLSNTVPDTFQKANNAKIISNAEFRLFMFHFADHNTKDLEAAQYWVHEFTFLVQFWVDRLGEPQNQGVITDIVTPIEDLQGNVIINDT